ncbi:TPA: DNA mismatch repair endonuclease MutL [Staphylococcus pseudintermedius]|uniref:DNA mismatch repair endonuclease MutL n=1 Tax=Staphylococcus pseudintermedius TaxID=283734 RepID=UPI001BDEDBDE|nr:DNA mismatch repair endonuclease MutL [Staphylococcus pseudintermedius]EHL7273550.1 DNA mismatch repair endonuclease MutL [Staphylococcus pseudintermedius]EHS7170962.1 DNA mismatch repair endonuclease MutL [Staphylococcus pseudintermedius]EJF1317217.1 DNA mismatch repair endonuclease MutL [Staphylococcus pseudintermedius]EJO7137410.1 DNA mismatch repair endonuclease MutL [Staphylococcus pseudintermedius]EJO7190716.1 DNA mismatch repair endonuclease MutL [Staphylococcus pseudintermedius]
MGKIKTLHTSLANKIAAGEVVERPSSVVKELLENSIDAGATEINIEVMESGIASIRVVDNGSGILQDDLGLVFHRHATSKLVEDDDLFHIRTLGFRGEALASIASVAKVTLQTSTDGVAGYEVYAEEGEIISEKPAKARKGTDIRVDALFYNTPARLKYIKSLYTELGKITDIVNRMAMSHPDIRIALSNDGKKILQTNGSGRTNEVMAEIYGMKVARDLIRIEGDTSDYHLTGYVAKPEHSRSNRHYISLFINGRYIKNFLLNKAVQEGYHTLMMIGRYPIVYLNIEMDPVLVDVNVHPTKLEVRLSKEDQLFDLIVAKIREAFKDQLLIPKNDLKSKYEPKKVLNQFEQQKMAFDQIQAAQTQTSHSNKEMTIDEELAPYTDVTEPSDTAKTPTTSETNDDYAERQRALLNDMVEAPSPINEVNSTDDSSDGATVSEIQQNHPQPSDKPKRRVPYMEVVGQVHGTYIIAQNDEGMYLIDQHAAQERIKYEYYRDKIGEVNNENQSLLIPLTFNFTKDEQLIIEQHLDPLREAGIFLEPFGGHDYIVDSYPVWFPQENVEEMIKDMIEYVIRHKKVDIAKFREEAAIMMSCKRSIKANHYLKPNEMADLIDQLGEMEDPFTCPHGRPVIINFSNYELERLFKRIQ